MIKAMMSKTKREKSSGKRASRRGWWLLAIILFALGATAFYYRAPIMGYSGAGAAYSARVACSCRYIGGRSLDDCAKDKLAGMELITLKEDEEAKSVTAQFPIIASETATYRKGFGCVLEKWED